MGIISEAIRILNLYEPIGMTYPTTSGDIQGDMRTWRFKTSPPMPRVETQGCLVHNWAALSSSDQTTTSRRLGRRYPNGGDAIVQVWE